MLTEAIKESIEQDHRLTQDSIGILVSTLESDLNSKIHEANGQRKEDAETTKRELSKTEERVSKKLVDALKRL